MVDMATAAQKRFGMEVGYQSAEERKESSTRWSTWPQPLKKGLVWRWGTRARRSARRVQQDGRHGHSRSKKVWYGGGVPERGGAQGEFNKMVDMATAAQKRFGMEVGYQSAEER